MLSAREMFKTRKDVVDTIEMAEDDVLDMFDRENTFAFEECTCP